MTTEPPFTVRARKLHGTITYRCPTPEWALKKLHDFQAATYDDISVIGPDGLSLTEADLMSKVDGPNGDASAARQVSAAAQASASISASTTDISQMAPSEG